MSNWTLLSDRTSYVVYMDNLTEAKLLSLTTVSQRVSASFRAYKASGGTLNGLANRTGIKRTTLRHKLDGHSEFAASELLILEKHLPGRFVDWVQDLLKADVA